MRILITGGGGFCGQHLKHFLEKYTTDIFTVGPKPNADRHHQINSFLDLDTLKRIIETVQPNYIFHLAGVSNTLNIQTYYEVNVLFAATLFQALKLSGHRDCPVLLVGTSAEYGFVSPNQVPINETTKERPFNHYGISKLAQTQMGLTLAQNGHPCVVVRPFNIIGSGMPKHLSVENFMRQIFRIIKKKQNPIIEVGNLESIRDFIDIKDVVQIYWKLIQNSSAYGQVVNVCSGKGTKIKDVLQKLIELSEIDIKIKVNPNYFKNVDVPVHYGNTEKLYRLIDDVPLTDLDATLKSIFEGFVK